MRGQSLIFNRSEVYLHEEFKDYVKGRRANIETDSEDYKRKVVEETYFKYLYHFCHWRSPYAGLGDKERHLKACEESAISTDWRQDSKTKKAVKKFYELQDIANTEFTLLNNFKRTLHVTGSAIQNQLTNLDFLLKVNDKAKTTLFTDDFKPTSEDFVNYMKTAEVIKGEIKDILPLGGKVQTLIEQIQTLEKQLEEDEDYGMKAKGGKKIGNRANPD